MSRVADVISCTEVDLVCIIVLVCLAHKAYGVGFDRPIKNKLFERALWFAVAANAMEIVWDIHANGYITLGQGAGWLVNAAYFMFLELSAFSWFIYAEVVESKDILHDRRKFLLSSIPQWMLALLLVVSAFNGWIFSVDETGVYHRGPLFFVQLLCSYGYVLYTMVKSLQVVLLRKNTSGRREYLVIASFALPVLICGVLQYLLPNLSLAAAGIAVSYMLVYLNSLQLMVSLDPVTGISDRRQFLLSLHSRAESLRGNARLYFLFIDVDDFKDVNDRYGHDEGDHVLRLVAESLRTVCTEYGASYGRYGGDEFTAAYTTEDELSAERFCRRLEDTLERRLEESLADNVGLSIGVVEFRRGQESVRELIIRADREMYLTKERKNGRTYDRGKENADGYLTVCAYAMWRIGWSGCGADSQREICCGG